MYERFTDRARKVMQLAGQEAQRLNHEYVGTEHVLLGLVAEGSGVAANVLRNLDLDVQRVRREVERIVQHGPAGQPVAAGRLPHTPRTKVVLGHAVEEARNLNHNYIGTEHLLLGLLREREGAAAQVLVHLGLKFEAVREEVLGLLGHELPPAAARVVVADALTDALTAPAELTAEQLQLVRDRVRQLNEQADRCRAEAAALDALLAWYGRRPR